MHAPLNLLKQRLKIPNEEHCNASVDVSYSAEEEYVISFKGRLVCSALNCVLFSETTLRATIS